MTCKDCGINIPSRARRCRACVIEYMTNGLAPLEKKKKVKLKKKEYKKRKPRDKIWIICLECDAKVYKDPTAKYCSDKCRTAKHNRAKSKRQKILERIKNANIR